jgi:hypothetical protein
MTNPQLSLAHDFVQFTDKNIFLTGKAGTGKTTFLKNLRLNCPKRMAVVAPTGVAAINAGGVTIHSFFQLPFGPFIPDRTEASALGSQNSLSSQMRFSREKIKLIKSLDLLVIDEISMVRADMLDAIDAVLKRFRNRTKPFGGLQLLMIGDLHQLSPVIKDEEWNLLKNYYPSVYFFNSRALQQTDPITIELKHIYRQADQYFIDLLNKVRDNQLDHHSLQELNERYQPDFEPRDDEGYITLTTHNATAQRTNQHKLESLVGKSYFFTAEIKNEFPEYMYPTEQELEMKVNAQVMFVKNDISKEKLFYNGKIGQITRIVDGVIYVKCPGDYAEIPVGIAEWQNIRYKLNEETKEITEEVIGSFLQFPLKLAWAITIHKSQGLTFERAIIDAGASFAHGQVYVALSRCKSFEGVVLRSPIVSNSVKTDRTIQEYTKEANQNSPDEEHLNAAKRGFQTALVQDLFDLTDIERRFFQFRKILRDNSNTVTHFVMDETEKLFNDFLEHSVKVTERFKPQLQQFVQQGTLPEMHGELQDRIKRAVPYFVQKLEVELLHSLYDLIIETDNKDVKKSATDALAALQREVFLKVKGFKACANGFQTLNLLQANANADADFQASVKLQPTKAKKAAHTENMAHGELYSELKAWRDATAAEKDASTYMILPQKVLLDLSNLLPTTLEELEVVKGFGKIKIKQFGSEVIEIIADYVRNNGIVKPQLELVKKEPKTKAEKVDTKKLSFDLYKAGWKIEEIAKERALSPQTIEGHLAHFVGTGDLDVYSFVPKAKVDAIADYLKRNPDQTLNAIKVSLGDATSFTDIKFVQQFLKHKV